ncbi:MAG: hypothetical protein MJ099_05195 [Clostridia bacterium]|nr:hypothetical protein [Clostridia bacterium]
MKKFIALLLAVACMLTVVALADAELTVLAKNYIELPDDDNAYFYAKLYNSGDAGCYVASGKLVGFSSKDDILVTEEYVSSTPSSLWLEPGDYCYVDESIWEDVLKEDDVVDYRYAVSTGNYGSKYYTLDCTAEFDLDYNYNNYVYVTATNTTNEIIADYVFTVALYDQNGDLIYVTYSSDSSTYLHPGATITKRIYISSDLAENYKYQNTIPTTVDAIFYVKEK